MILHADEATLTVLNESGRKARQKSCVRVCRTSGDSRKPVVLYDCQPSQAGKCAGNFPDGFTGYLHTDGYEVVSLQAAAGNHHSGIPGANAHVR